MNKDNKYEMTIGLNVFKHLGLHLYSNVPAVLSEVVANSYDADAKNVYIKIEEDNIIIEDDGSGMDLEDINEKYLYIGYQKRIKGQTVSPIFKRPFMGRKGIGKLSLFSIANNVEIFSAKNNEKNGLTINRYEVEKQITKNKNKFYPTDIPSSDFDIKKGTRIIISDLKKNINRTETFLRRRLARRFSVLGAEYNFEVHLNSNPITLNDRNFFKSVQFLWLIGEEEDNYTSNFPNIKKVNSFDGNVDSGKYIISGWVGTVEKPSQLEQDETNNNKITIITRGKMAQEDVLDTFNEGGIYADYLIGEIRADFLDSDTEEDIATSSRQRLFEEDERYKALIGKLSVLLGQIKNVWTEFRKDLTTDKALTENPILKEWYSSLSTSKAKDQAKKLFQRIETLHYDEDKEKKEKRELYKQGILAFERLRLKDSLEELDKLNTADEIKLAGIFSEIEDIESVMYYDIASERVSLIRELQDIVDENQKEKLIQKHIFDNLWLLNPSLERATRGSGLLEKRFSTEFKKVIEKLTEAEKLARFDVKYRTSPGKHIIVELKRYNPSYKIDLITLASQVYKYKTTLEKILKSIGKPNEPIEIVCILGKQLDDDPITIEKQLAVYNARLVYYDNLINDALESYEEYLIREKEVGKLKNIIDRL